MTAARLRLEIQGAVQGVGFRPFVFRLAEELGLAGWVINDSRGVFVEVEGERDRLERFAARVRAEPPPRAILHAVATAWLAPAGFTRFEIRASDEAGAKTVVVLPDVATCPACLAEVLDPADRRHRYPFTNCTDCGPRFTIVEALPYDRPNTTMRGFVQCADCRREYEDPRDRRFHAQPNACPRCGPRLSLLDAAGVELAAGDEALAEAAAALARGEILAAKGLGGFHLLVDAGDEQAVAALRERKARRDKPLALMVRDLDGAREICEVPPAAADLLAGPEAPIVLLRRRADSRVAIAEGVAPGNPHLGVMLPYTPFHHLLLAAAGRPLVATSGNLSDEPIATDNAEALARLGRIADRFLVHDRPIARHADDSVAWLVEGAPQLLRRARGWAPLPVLLSGEVPRILAVGAHQKNVVALSVGGAGGGARGRAFLSQHLGDMETPEAFAAFERVVADFLRLYEATPVAIAHDLHPDYPTTRWAVAAAAGVTASPDAGQEGWRTALAGLPTIAVQHHHAHMASCLAENGIVGPALGITWDGTGYGPDGTVWGGEFLFGDAASCRRVARLRPFRLPGGEAAVREPRRVALALLWELLGESALERDDLPPVAACTDVERRLLGRMIDRGFRSPWTTSAGRLFDGVAALVGLHPRVSFEGQAAMALEFAAAGKTEDDGAYPLDVVPAGQAASAGDPGTATADAAAPAADDPALLELDWRPLVAALLADVRRGVRRGIIAARFHAALADAAVAVARAVGAERVALTGGCFQNRLLTAGAARRLRRAGCEVLLHRRVPPNDGGISLGQIAVAAALLADGGGRRMTAAEESEVPPCV